MYHPCKERTDVEITAAAMEVGPTCHDRMGGVRVSPETQESTVPGVFAAGEVGGGMHGANRLGGNSLSDLLVFGKRAGRFAAARAKELGSVGQIDRAAVEQAAAESLRPFELRVNRGENPFELCDDLQKVMQDLVGIVRNEDDLRQVLERIAELRARAVNVRCGGKIQYNPGWHLALDVENMLDISKAVTRAALVPPEIR